MALRKAVQCIVILLVIWNCLKYEGHREFLNGFFEELTSAEHSSIHLRQKREKRETSSNSTEYELQAVISISDLKHFQSILNTLSFPLSINTTGEITSINTTTVCSPNITANITGYQCTCEESFAWSYNKCINYGACDAIIGDTCGCINGLPADGQYCQLNTSQPGPVEFDIDFNLLFPISSLPQNFIDLFRDYVGNLSFPQTITQSLIIEDLNFTTWCNPNSTEGLQCQCEDQFGWSCDKCVLYGACSNVTSQTCGCIKGLPPGGEFCQPISSISPCPTPPPESVEFNIDLLLPISSLPPNFIDLFRDYVGNVSFPQNITQSLIIEDLNFTTWCYPNSTGGLQCQCEGQFAWSCDKCVLYSACSNVTSQTCGCIKGLPPGGEFCQPISSISPCPTPPPEPVDFDIVIELRIPVSSVPPNFSDEFRHYLENFSFPQLITQSLIIEDLNFTTWCYPNSTGGMQCQCQDQFAWSCDKCEIYGACSNVTSQTCGCIKGLPPDGEFCEPIASIAQCPPPPSGPVDFDIVVDIEIPVSSVLPNFNDEIRHALRNLSFPYLITQSLIIEDLNFTTWCYPNSTGGLQCQCEGQFAWSCDKCDEYGACSNVTSQTCDCIKGLPVSGEFCQPITNISLCPTTTTPVTTPSTTSPTPTYVPVDFDIDLELHIPASSVPQNFSVVLRDILRNFSFPKIITGSLTLKDLNFTTWCYPNSTGGLQCQCEDQLAWSCDKCEVYGACGDVNYPTCDCIKGLPPNGEFCQPITNISLCPTTTTLVTTPSTTSTTSTYVTTPSTTSPTTTYVTTPSTTSPTPTYAPVAFYIAVELHISAASVPSNISVVLRDILKYVAPPQIDSLTVEDLNFTTWCSPISTGVQCQCEDQFAWSCDKCEVYGACSNATSETCGCIKGLPPGGELCQPISTFNPCRPPTRTTTMTTTTPTMPNTTTPMPVTPTTTTTTTITTPTTTTTLTTTLIIQILEITMDVEFKEEYNQETNEFHKTVSKTITDEAASQGIKANLIQFRSGSTIAQYNVSAPSSITPDFRALNVKIFNKLAESYPMIFDASGTLMFSPTDGFYEQTVTVTCGPPPLDLNFGTVSAAEWRLNTVLIAEDGGHTISVKDGISTLTVSRFISSDDGEYECRLMRKKDKTFFRQKSATFSLKTKPTITVSPIREYVQCQGGIVPLKCSVSGGYQVEFQEYSEAGTGNSITYNYKTPQGCQKQDKVFTCQSKTQPVFTRTITLQLSPEEAHCVDEKFGKGNEGFKAAVPCEPNQVGEITAVCKENRQFGDIEENCILLPVQELLDESEFLTASTLPVFLEQLSNVTVNFTGEVIKSPPNVKAIVRILTNVAKKSSSLDISISNDSMENVLITAGVLTINGTTWNFLNNNDTKNISNSTDAESVSSSFLDSLENITSHLDNTTFDIKTAYILLNRTRFTDTFSAELNSSVAIEIPEADGEIKTITTILFESLDNVLPARDEVNSSFNSINGRIVLVQSTGDINNISFTFDILNDTLGNPECVFWNFSLFNGLGGWDNEGCEVVLNTNETGTVICNCNHLTSFSILMSPNSPKKLYLDIITYIGVGISMVSLVICLIIEGLIWRKIRKNETSYLRHVSIVNIAVSLLVANIWFIIGAAISDAEVKNPPACTAATFFIHFFYLALFFWMLASAMLLLYRTTNVFGGGLTKASMLAIGFSLGYGAPLIIATVTIAATAPDNKYIRDNAVCWLNWDESKALLAFVIPALSIVVINLIILVVVLYKIIRRRVGTTAAQADERHVLLVIVKSLAVLTPFFGITWGLGAGILADPTNEGIHIAFAFFNSLQGFFILVFGTLLDSKVRSAIASYAQPSRTRTGSTSAGNTSSSGLQFLRNWRRGRDGYNMTSSASSDLHSASNT
ncbi:adhesion G protein-coupled receptor F5 [Oreochromis aureus]|uniref:Adhesion G protein-coupled receptor F5-like n=1 Tax=Oreochromis aureus TaxID=47969 RepID=A0AAZ1WWP5_OREAU|nr:adhesion G protein-coupled receptor F5 [Oreochromis aureus]